MLFIKFYIKDIKWIIVTIDSIIIAVKYKDNHRLSINKLLDNYIKF
jgi:hypothetical protein